MRLAPVALRWSDDLEKAVQAARAQSTTTHGAPAAVEGCALLAEILIEAIATGDKAMVLRSRSSTEPSIAGIAAGSWRGKRRDAIRSSGYVVHTLEAALWCVDRAADFREAVLLATNLADDADTVAAVTGQIAGALWGRRGIPPHWLDRLAWREEIENRAGQLLALVATHHAKELLHSRVLADLPKSVQPCGVNQFCALGIERARLAWPGEIPVQRLKAWLNAALSEYPRSHAAC
jgi:ADP-ribosylglycohydrolase